MPNLKISQADMDAIYNNSVEFIGEGSWGKNMAYQVYKIEDRYVAIAVLDNQNKWLCEWSAEYIHADDVNRYI